MGGRKGGNGRKGRKWEEMGGKGRKWEEMGGNGRKWMSALPYS